jgi:hypothetical protein
LAAPLHATRSGTQPPPNYGTTGDEAEWTESGSAGKEHRRPKDEHGYPESENERHGRIAPDDQDDDIECI